MPNGEKTRHSTKKAEQIVTKICTDGWERKKPTPPAPSSAPHIYSSLWYALLFDESLHNQPAKHN